MNRLDGDGFRTPHTPSPRSRVRHGLVAAVATAASLALVVPLAGPGKTDAGSATDVRTARHGATSVPASDATTLASTTKVHGLKASTPLYKRRPVTKSRLVVVLLQNGTRDETKAYLADDAGWKTSYFVDMKAWFERVTQGLYEYVPVGEGVYKAPASEETLTSSAAGCAGSTANQDVNAYLAELGLEGGRDYDTIATHQQIDGCYWAGLGTVGDPRGNGGRIWTGTTSPMGVRLHEFGHNRGMQHAAVTFCPGGKMTNCTDRAGGSVPSPLGFQDPGVGYTAVERLGAGFILNNQYRYAKGTGTLKLTPALAPRSVGGVRALEIPGGKGYHYVIEYRKPQGTFDTAVAKAPGIRIYKVALKDGKPDYLRGAMVQIADGPNESGQFDPGETLKDGSLKIKAGKNGLVTVTRS